MRQNSEKLTRHHGGNKNCNSSYLKKGDFDYKRPRIERINETLHR